MKTEKLFEDDPVLDLKKQLMELERAFIKRDAEAKRLADFIIKVKNRPAGVNPELMLLLVAVLCCARLAYFALVEDWGKRAVAEGLGVSIGTLAAMAAILIVWGYQEVRINKWGMAAKAACLVVGLRIGVDQWMRGHAAYGVQIAVGMALFCGLPLIDAALEKAAQFLVSPRLAIGKK
jgi:hypothetical protein